MSYAPDDAEFLRMVRYFYEEKGNPQRYAYWDEGRFRALRPGAYRSWMNHRLGEEASDYAFSRLEEEDTHVRATWDTWESAPLALQNIPRSKT